MTRWMFPGIGMVLSLGQVIYCLSVGDWPRAGYWGCCIGIAFFVTV